MLPESIIKHHCTDFLKCCRENPVRITRRLFNRAVECIGGSEFVASFSKNSIIAQVRFSVEKWLFLRELGFVESKMEGGSELDLESQETGISSDEVKNKDRIFDYQLSCYLMGGIVTLGLLYRLYEHIPTISQFTVISLACGISFVIFTYFLALLIHYQEGSFGKYNKVKIN